MNITRKLAIIGTIAALGTAPIVAHAGDDGDDTAALIMTIDAITIEWCDLVVNAITIGEIDAQTAIERTLVLYNDNFNPTAPVLDHLRGVLEGCVD